MVDIEFKNLDKLIQQYDPRVVNQSLSRTVNDIARKAKTQVSKEVRVVYNVKAGEINKTVTIKRANASNPDAMLRWVGSKIGLAHFGLRVRNVSVTATSKTGKKFKTKRKQSRVKVRKNKGLKVASGQYAKGFTHDKKRIYARKKGSDNLAVLLGPSVPEMVDDRNVIDPIQQLIKTDFEKGFKRNMEFYLGKKVGLY